MKKIFTFLFALIIGAGTMFADLREGVLPGEFHVSPTKKVHFSSGNFQSCRNGNRLAEHQYDFVGASNKKISSSWSYNGYFDLFGWGKVYYTYTTDSSAYATYTEWGEYPLSNADNDAQWRTLTIDEWKYLLCSSPAHIGFGTVAEKKGLILLPGGVLPDVEAAGLSFVSIKKEDQWETIVDNGIIGIKSKSTYFSDNTIDATLWENLEKLGAVFLPAAYYRTTSSASATEVDAVLYTGEGCGYYWSSSPVEGTIQTAGFVSFGVAQYPAGESHVYTYETADANKKRYTGMSVRLVTENGEYNPVMELDPIKFDMDGDAEITFNYSGPSSSSVLQTLQEDDYYDDNNSCLALCTPLQDSHVATLMDEVQQAISDFTSKFSGISFFLPAGKGELKMDICTYGLQLSVHIGNAIAHLTQNERGESVLQYDIPEPTLVCMHAIEIELGNVAGRHARKQVNDEKKRVELYSMKIEHETSSSTGISSVQSDNMLCTKVLRDGQLFILRGGKTFTLQGQEVR